MAKIAINKSLLKEYKTSTDPRVVYMNDGDEFQIQLFNSETETIGAEVSINGKVIPGILVIRPGERIWLERYFNERAKFKFTTYEVDDPGEDTSVAKAIANNGVVEIKFYKERQKPTVDFSNDIWISKSSTLLGGNSDISWDMYDTVTTSKGISNNLFKSEISDTVVNKISSDLSLDTNVAKGCCDTRSFSFADDKLTTTANSTKGFTDINNIVTSNGTKYRSMASKKITDIDNSYRSATPISNKIETGRVGKGSYSSQTFNYVNIEFESWYFRKETIKILPSSRKPFTSSDIQKVYCTNCGRKLNSKYKFCPYCGEKCI